MLENAYPYLCLIFPCVSEIFYWRGVKPRILQTENLNNSYGLTEKEKEIHFNCNLKRCLQGKLHTFSPNGMLVISFLRFSRKHKNWTIQSLIQRYSCLVISNPNFQPRTCYGKFWGFKKPRSFRTCISFLLKTQKTVNST